MRNQIFSAVLLLAGALLAAAPASAQAMRIATIRSTELVQSSPQFKAGQDKMKAEFERRATELEAEAKKLAEDIKNFQKSSDLLAAADRAKQEKDLNTRKIDFEYKSRQFQEERTTRERQLFADMMTRIKSVIEAVAKERGIDLVVENPVYAAPSVDITADVLTRLQSAK